MARKTRARMARIQASPHRRGQRRRAPQIPAAAPRIDAARHQRPPRPRHLAAHLLRRVRRPARQANHREGARRQRIAASRLPHERVSIFKSAHTATEETKWPPQLRTSPPTQPQIRSSARQSSTSSGAGVTCRPHSTRWASTSRPSPSPRPRLKANSPPKPAPSTAAPSASSSCTSPTTNSASGCSSRWSRRHPRPTRPAFSATSSAPISSSRSFSRATSAPSASRSKDLRC